MTIAEVLAGESKNVEFGKNLSEKSIKYIKPVITFVNGTGGKIIFGVADRTREVAGSSKEDVLRKVDTIANTISDSCRPATIPGVAAQTVDRKTVIVLEVFEGRQHPYYIKALSREDDVYVRVVGITHLADEYMMKELLFEDSNHHFDQGLCTGLSITDEEIEEPCKAMEAQVIKNIRSNEQKESIRDICRQQLHFRGILIKWDGRDYPANAFAILAGYGELYVTAQCDVFKGMTKEVFAGQHEYDDPLRKQVEKTYQLVLRNIRLGAAFGGVYQQDVYEVPPNVTHEPIINTVVHHSYLDRSTTQAAICDNRSKIAPPGKLPMGQTIERVKEGHSEIRNEALAYVFSYMNLTEYWGNDILRIIGKIKAAGLRAPKPIGGDMDLRINTYRNQNAVSNTANNANISANGTNGGVNVLTTKEREQVKNLLDAIGQNPFAA